MAIELNVTEYTTVQADKVLINSTVIQTANIAKAINQANKDSFSSSVYFPGGFYVIDNNILNRSLEASTPTTAKLLIRGDGPGATVLRFFSEKFPLPAMANPSQWSYVDSSPAPTSPLPNFKVLSAVAGSTATIATLVSTPFKLPPLPANALFSYNRRYPTQGWVSGIKLRLTTSSTENGTYTIVTGSLDQPSSANNAFAKKQFTPSAATILEAFYRFELEVPVNSDGKTLPAVEIDIAVAEMPWATGDRTIFDISGKGASQAELSLSTGFSLRDLTLDGGATFRPNGDLYSGYGVDWLKLSRCGLIQLDRVLIQNTDGYALNAECLWDSNFVDVQFENCGRAYSATKKPAVRMAAYGTTQSEYKYLCCNNLKYIGCRWEGSQYMSVLMEKETRAIFYLGSKWHGKLPTPVTSTTPQVRMESATNNIMFNSCRLTNWGYSHIEADSCNNIVITGSAISGAGPTGTSPSEAYGISLKNSLFCVVSDNSFGPAGLEAVNKSGDVNVSGGWGNLVTENTTSPSGKFRLADDFVCGQEASKQIGELLWTAIGNPPQLTYLDAEVGHPGILQIKSGAAGGPYGITLAHGNPPANPTVGRMILPSDFFELVFVLRCNGLSDTQYSFGLAGLSNSAVLDPADGIYFSNSGTTGTLGNWVGNCVKGGSKLSTLTIIPCDTTTPTWRRFRLRRVNASTIGFSIERNQTDSEQTLNNAANIPIVPLNAFFVFQNNASTSPTDRSFDLDYVELNGVKLQRTVSTTA